MRFLLDTSVLLFWASGGERLRAAQFAAVADGANEIFVSAISAAEVRVKVSIGKLDDPIGLFDSLADRGFLELPFTIADAEALADLELIHRDPFDRMLVAQAVRNELTLITSDDRLREYPVSTL